MKYFEKEWNCSACGNRNSALRHLHCKACGHPKGPQDTEIFTDNEITDEVGLQLAKGAPHWACEYCGSVNLYKESDCSGCGNPKGSKGNTTFKVKELGNQNPAYHHPTDNSRSQSDKSYNPGTKTERAADITNRQYRSFAVILKNPKLYWVIGIAAAVILLFAFLFSTKDYEATIHGVAWEREITIESYEQFHEEGWTKAPDAYNVTSYSKIRSYRDVYRTETRTVTEYETRYRDNGNGSSSSYTVPITKTVTERVFDHSEPVYDTWYEYDVDRWTYARKVTASGTEKEPYWPEYTLNDVGGKYGDEREGKRTEHYTVSFKANINGKAKVFSRNAEFEKWQDYNLGDVYKIKVNRLGAMVGEPVKYINK